MIRYTELDIFPMRVVEGQIYLSVIFEDREVNYIENVADGAEHKVTFEQIKEQINNTLAHISKGGNYKNVQLAHEKAKAFLEIAEKQKANALFVDYEDSQPTSSHNLLITMYYADKIDDELIMKLLTSSSSIAQEWAMELKEKIDRKSSLKSRIIARAKRW